MPRYRTALLLLATILVGVLLDQMTKQWAISVLVDTAPQSFLGDSFRLQFAMNSGGFLSIGDGLSQPFRYAVFIGFNGLLMLGLLGYLGSVRNTSPLRDTGIALLLAGGIGNLIDRLIYEGQVIDFLNIGIGSLRSGIFNVADMAIVLGAVLVVAVGFKPLAPPAGDWDVEAVEPSQQ